MELRTVMLMLAVGSFLFGLMLVVFKISQNNPQNVPFWITAKMLQAAGSLMLYYRTTSFDSLTLLANMVLLLGCAYEAWAVRTLSGQTVKRHVHLLVAVGIVLICSLAMLMDSPHRTGIFFSLQGILYFLPGLFLLSKADNQKFSLQLLMAVCYSITGMVFLIAAVICLTFPEYAFNPGRNPITGIIPLVSFCIFLVSGFVLLMLAKEQSDIQIAEIQKTLQKSEVRFQRIVETAIEGILVFDQHYRITFANKNMAKMLGYTAEEIIGKPYISLFPESQLDVYYTQEALRKKGEDSVYECRLLGKDGRSHWFLVSARAILDDAGQFEGSFAMLTDINERKEMELLLEETNRRLTELSNTDSLTGIANRRNFDDTLQREYSRLTRSKSKLSVILLDVDHFKEYNDCYGHVMGDECLRKIGRVLEQCINRAVDLAARYGGEEFACILPDTDITAAVKIAENIRQNIEDLKIEHIKSTVSRFVTASLGVTTVEYASHISPEKIIAMADKLLYQAKVSGRNQIRYAEAK